MPSIIAPSPADEAMLPTICTVCGTPDRTPSGRATPWASTTPPICTRCVVSAVEGATGSPSTSLRVVSHAGGVDPMLCDGDGNVDATRMHSPACNGHLYPDEQYIEARYALGGRLDDPQSVVVTMRHSLACYAAFHLIGPSVSNGVDDATDTPTSEAMHDVISRGGVDG